MQHHGQLHQQPTRESTECKTDALRKGALLESKSKQVSRGKDRWVAHLFGYGWCTGEVELIPCGFNASMVWTVMVLMGFQHSYGEEQ